jgi:Fic family protein
VKRGFLMGKFTDKYHLNKSQSLFLAEKGQIKNIYCGMKMENRTVTLDQTQSILNGINVPNVQLDDIQAILNMRDAWKFLLNTISETVTFEYWCKLNDYIARNEALEWGKLRTGNVEISGTDYVPPIPEKEKVIAGLEDIVSDKDITATEKALEIFVWGTKGQFFWDGNKRTSLMLANKILISAGAGIMTITDKYMEQFNVSLLEYYNTGKSDKLKRFLYDNAIRHTW